MADYKINLRYPISPNPFPFNIGAGEFLGLYYQVAGNVYVPIAASTSANNLVLIDKIMTALIAVYGGTYNVESVSTEAGDRISIIQWNGATLPAVNGNLISFILTAIEYVIHVYPGSATVEPTTCDTCKQVTVKACQASYTITTGLTPATTYTAALHAGNGNTYTQEVTTDGSGNITIDTTATGFPDGLFTPESGGYILKVYPDADLGTPEDLTIGAVVYTCIQLNFTYVTTTT